MGNGSWKESVCIVTLLVALVLAVLSVLYGDVVLLYLWPFCIDCLCCWEHLKPAVVFSPCRFCVYWVFLQWSWKNCTPSSWSASGSWPGLSVMSNGLERSFCPSLGCMGDILMGSMVNSPLLNSMEDLSSIHGGLRWQLGVTGAVCPPTAWLCVAGSWISPGGTALAHWWVLLPIYGWFLFWNKT